MAKLLKSKKPAAKAGEPAAPKNPAPKSAPQTSVNTKNKNTTQDKVVLGVLMAIGLLIYLFVNSGMDDMATGEESVIPLAQLTGRIGSAPKDETLEQQFRRENRNIPLSTGSTIPAEVVNERTRLFRQVPFGDEELAYEMRLPTNWGQSQFTQYGTPGQEKYAVLTNIDRFFGPVLEDVRPFVWVEVERLNRATMAQYYMDLYLIKRGISPEAVRVDGPDRAEALYVNVRDEAAYAMRSLFVMNGDRMMVLTFAVPLQVYQTYKDLMGLTLASFKPLQKIERQPEPLAGYKLLNVLTFDYVKRWETRNENRTTSLNPSVELVLPTELNTDKYALKYGDNQIEGLILIQAWRNTPDFNRSTLEQAVIKRLGMGGLKLRDVLQPEKNLPARPGMPKISQAVYIGIVDKSEPTTEEFGVIQSEASFPRQEVWVTIFDNGSYTAAVTLVTWPQTKNYMQWATNNVGYQTILNSLKLRALGF